MIIRDVYWYGGIVINDRGNGCGGPGYISETDPDMDSIGETRVSTVSRADDPEAWRLMVEACAAQGLSAPTEVYVGEPDDASPSAHQMIYGQ